MRKKSGNKGSIFDHGDAEARQRKAYERLGTDSPKCIYCPETNPTVLELHHVAGRQYGNELVIVCRNHHRLLSNVQKDHPPKIIGCNDPHEYWAHLLLSIADLLVLAVEFLRDIASKLLAHARMRASAATHPDAVL